MTIARFREPLARGRPGPAKAQIDARRRRRRSAVAGVFWALAATMLAAAGLITFQLLVTLFTLD